MRYQVLGLQLYRLDVTAILFQVYILITTSIHIFKSKTGDFLSGPGTEVINAWIPPVIS
jgi:hypothetical protein